jgi:hypothetical protein
MTTAPTPFPTTPFVPTRVDANPDALRRVGTALIAAGLALLRAADGGSIAPGLEAELQELVGRAALLAGRVGSDTGMSPRG